MCIRDSQATAQEVVSEGPNLDDLAVGCYCFPGDKVWTAPAGLGYTYQWFRDGIPVFGPTTNNQYTMTTSGVYTVIVTNAVGCSTESEDIIMDIGDQCGKCDLNIDILDLQCIGIDPATGDNIYSFDLLVLNNGVGLSGFSGTSTNGGIVSALNPQSIGGGGSTTTVTGTLTIPSSVGFDCIIFGGVGVDGIYCEQEVCFEFPPCDGGEPCNIEFGEPRVRCIFSADGQATYGFSIPANNMGTATQLIWQPCEPGNVSIAIDGSVPDPIPGGTVTNINGTITATNGIGGTCLIVYGIDPITGEVCNKWTIKIELPDCEEIEPCEAIKFLSKEISCGSPFIDALNNRNYSISLSISSFSGGTAFIASSPSMYENTLTNVNISGSGSIYTFSFDVVDFPPDNGEICFFVYVYDLGGKVCFAEICIPVPDCSGSKAVDIFDLDTNPITATELTVMPNPATDQITIDLQLANEQPAELRVFGVNGQIVRSIILLNTDIRLPLDVSDLGGGVYMIGIYQSGQLVAKERVAIIKRQ